MLVTEDEAKGKRCQEGYAASPGATRMPDTESAVVMHPVQTASPGAGVCVGVTSSAEPKTAPIFCLGSGCMAWRWQKPTLSERVRDAGAGMNVFGYCGKAGKI